MFDKSGFCRCQLHSVRVSAIVRESPGRRHNPSEQRRRNFLIQHRVRTLQRENQFRHHLRDRAGRRIAPFNLTKFPRRIDRNVHRRRIVHNPTIFRQSRVQISRRRHPQR